VCIDVYAASEEGLGLAYMEPLSSATGGAVFLYIWLDQAALPQVTASPWILSAMLTCFGMHVTVT